MSKCTRLETAALHAVAGVGSEEDVKSLAKVIVEFGEETAVLHALSVLSETVSRERKSAKFYSNMASAEAALGAASHEAPRPQKDEAG